VSRRKDPQATRLYKWQWEWRDWNTQNITFEQANEIADKACEAWSIPPPRKFKLGKAGGKFSVYEDGSRSLTLLPEHLNTAMTLHEISHHITDIRYGSGYQYHGPEFMGVFLDLLADFNVAPRKTLFYSARQAGLKITPINTDPK